MSNITIDKDDKKPTVCYMIGCDFLYELGEVMGGATVFTNIADIYESRSYFSETYPPQDGIVKVKVTFLEHIPADKAWSEKLTEENNE